MNYKKIVLLLIFCFLILLICGIIYFKNKTDNQSVKTAYIIDKGITETKCLLGDSDLTEKLKYNNKEVYITGSYSRYDLECFDKNTNTTEIIDKLVGCVTILDNTLYYIKNDDIIKLYRYNLDTNEKENLNMPHNICSGTYSIVAYDNNIYFSVFGNTLSQSSYGIIKYDLIAKEYKVFSELDIRYLDENFLFINNGFLTCKNSKLIFIDSNGNEEIKCDFKEELDNYYRLYEKIVKVDENTIEIPVMTLGEKKSYWIEIGYLKINIKDYSAEKYY